MRAAAALLVLLALLLLLCPLVAHGVATCTVSSNSGDTPDFTDLQAALDTCRAPNDYDVLIVVNGTFSVSGLVIPNDIATLYIAGATGNATDVILTYHSNGTQH